MIIRSYRNCDCETTMLLVLFLTVNNPLSKEGKRLYLGDDINQAYHCSADISDSTIVLQCLNSQ